MKVVILAGGYGTRISEESQLKPKPMIEIGGRPILWHIMKIYATHGLNEFVICCGYKGYMIKEYFANYFLHRSDVTFDLEHNTLQYHKGNAEKWKVTLVDTGEDTMTGGRLKRVADYLDTSTFCMTYGDGVGNVDITALIKAHQASSCKATLTAVQPMSRFGALSFDGDQITGFKEKPPEEAGWINGGFFVLEPGVLDLIEGDATVWEQGPLEQLASSRQLNAYHHHGFWQPMDTLRDKHALENMWRAGNAEWRVW